MRAGVASGTEACLGVDSGTARTRVSLTIFVGQASWAMAVVGVGLGPTRGPKGRPGPTARRPRAFGQGPGDGVTGHEVGPGVAAALGAPARADAAAAIFATATDGVGKVEGPGVRRPTTAAGPGPEGLAGTGTSGGATRPAEAEAAEADGRSSIVKGVTA